MTDSDFLLARNRFLRRLAAYGAHLYTATGLVFALLTAAAILEHDYRLALIWNFVALAVDSSDGFLARKVRVRDVVPGLDGRRLDDIIDYVNYTFLPLMLIGDAGWLPAPDTLWLSVAAVASALAFSKTGAKEDSRGFFVGFPSYWNVVALYFFLFVSRYDSSVMLVIVLVLSVLSVLPLRFVYPSHFGRLKLFFNGGAVVWVLLILWILLRQPAEADWLVLVSMLYPALYMVLSFGFDLKERRSRNGGERF